MISAPSKPVQDGPVLSMHRNGPAEPPTRGRKGERGQSLVEFVLVLPLFLVLVLAAIDFGWALRSYIVATNSAREGARIGVFGESEDVIIAKVVSTSGALLTDSNVQVIGAQGKSGHQLEVKVSYSYNWITPLGGVLSILSGGTLPTPLPISTYANMRLD